MDILRARTGNCTPGVLEMRPAKEYAGRVYSPSLLCGASSRIIVSQVSFQPAFTPASHAEASIIAAVALHVFSHAPGCPSHTHSEMPPPALLLHGR